MTTKKGFSARATLFSKTLFGCAAFAFASSATYAGTLGVYGQGHLSIDQVDDGTDSTLHATSSSSRLGFKGAHSLANGTEVFFQYETGVDLTAQGANDGNGSNATHTGQIFTRGRPTFVGLRGHAGEILIGHTPGLDQWVNDQNYFADQIGDVGIFWENGVVGGRLDNVIQYSTPDMGGMSATLTYVPDENDTNEDVMALKGNYAADRLKAGFAYATSGSGVSDDDASLFALTAGYDFGQFTLGGGFQSASDINGTPGNDRDDFFVGFSFNLSDSSKVKAQFASSSGEGDNTDATLFAIGYDKKLDEHTTVYVAYAATDNDDLVNFTVNGKGHGDAVTPAVGEDPSAFSIGIVSAFDVSLMK